MDFNDYENFVPKYKQIQKYIIDQIENGQLKKGDKIPSEIELAEKFSVSRVTANSAIKELTTLGIIRRFQGLGSYVDDTAFSANSSSMLFAQNTKINSQHSFLGDKKHQLISIQKVKPSKYYQKLFDIDEGTPLVEIVRTVEINGQVMDVDCSYCLASLYNKHNANFDLNSEEHKKVLTEQYFHDYLKNILGLRPKYISVFMRSNPNDFAYKDLINLNEDEKVLLWNLVVYDERRNILGVTTTMSKKSDNKAFFTLEL